GEPNTAEAVGLYLDYSKNRNGSSAPCGSWRGNVKEIQHSGTSLVHSLFLYDPPYPCYERNQKRRDNHGCAS
ncbi:MAG TPA: hypothetical protein VE131_00735, partial [Terriglobales bacterium]|nr:hypothetical protein [Terriglobales bacterium]